MQLLNFTTRFNKERIENPGDLIGYKVEDQFENFLEFIEESVGQTIFTDSERFFGFEIFKRLLKIYNPNVNLTILTYLI